MYLSVVLVGNEYLGIGQVVVITAVAEIEALRGAVLKVKDDLRTLAENQACSCRQLGAVEHSRYAGGGDGGLCGSGKYQTVDGAGSRIFNGKGKVGSLCLDFVQTVLGDDAQLCGLAIRNGKVVGSKGDAVGNDNMQCHRADACTVVLGSDGHVACGVACGVNAVGNGAGGRLVGDVGRQISRRTGGAYACNGQLRGGAGRDVLVRYAHGHVVKSGGGLCQ